MAVLNTADMLDLARTLAQDDANTLYLKDADWLRLINEAYCDYAAEVDNSVVSLGAVSVSRDTPGTTYRRPLGRYLVTLTTSSYIGQPRKFLRCSSGNDTLERLEVPEILRLREMGAAGVPQTGYPKYWAIEKASTKTAGTPPNTNEYAPPKYYLYLFPDTTTKPPLTTQQFGLYGEAHPRPLDLSNYTEPNLSEAESRWVARIAAARGAALIGRSPDFIQQILSDIPKNIQLGQRISGQFLKPRIRPGEEPI